MKTMIDMDEAYDLATLRLNKIYAEDCELEAWDKLISLLKQIRAQCEKEMKE